ncbi:DUF3593 domain-containing protein [Prochlorococcus marinus]|uniref:DUF3593 domain-containing protein n=1 Tax=Prochlorococcus marinus TaxID=1219 RepID=UPI0005A0140F|nr:DUF3593 domain-containing protein [Prochlorococcus marinus]
MNDFFLRFIDFLSKFDNTALFAASIIPYSIFLYFLYKIKSINKLIKTGFSLTVLFVFITIVISIYSLSYLNLTLVEVDVLHGSAEFFLTLSDAVILVGFIKMFKVIR